MDADRLLTPLNPLLIALLHSPLHFPVSLGLMTLSYTGRRSRRRITIPVGYQRDGETLDVLVSKAQRKNWWRNFETPAPVELRLRGRRLRGRAELIDPTSEIFTAACRRSFDRLPLLPRQFGIVDYRKRDGLSHTQREILAHQGRLVRVDLRDGK